MLADTPQIAGQGLGPALVLGEGAQVRAALKRDPGLATRTDPRTGWTPLHVVCGSRWHVLDPARTDGLVAVAQLLLDAGADVGALIEWRPRRPGGRTPLGCATATAISSAGNEPLIALLLERGAAVADDDLYSPGSRPTPSRACACCLRPCRMSLRSLARRSPPPVSNRDVRVVRVLLDAGADPRRYCDDDRPADVGDPCGDLVRLRRRADRAAAGAWRGSGRSRAWRPLALPARDRAGTGRSRRRGLARSHG
jgi:hypothetical protein